MSKFAPRDMWCQVRGWFSSSTGFFENLPKKDFVHIYEHIKVQTVRDGSKNLFTESFFLEKKNP